METPHSDFNQETLRCVQDRLLLQFLSDLPLLALAFALSGGEVGSAVVVPCRHHECHHGRNEETFEAESVCFENIDVGPGRHEGTATHVHFTFIHACVPCAHRGTWCFCESVRSVNRKVAGTPQSRAHTRKRTTSTCVACHVLVVLVHA